MLASRTGSKFGHAIHASYGSVREAASSRLRSIGLHDFATNSSTFSVVTFLCSVVAGQHARGALAGAQALGELERDLAVGRRLAGLDAQLVAQVVQQSPRRRAARKLIERQTQARVSPSGCVLLEEAVEASSCLALRPAPGRAARRSRRPPASGTQRSRSLTRCSAGSVTACLRRIAREVGLDRLRSSRRSSMRSSRSCRIVLVYRSSSAAMMFKLPSTATTSLSVCPPIKYGNSGKVNERRRPAAGPVGHVACRRRRRRSPARRWATSVAA